MRVLFFLEPVIFQGAPTFLEAHFMWVQCFARAAHAMGGTLALAGNAEICETWCRSALNDRGMQACFPLDSFGPLKPFAYDRHRYSRALYGPGRDSNPLTSQLQAAAHEFAPDLVVLTSQNAFARVAFDGLPQLCIEQASLPRLGHSLRTGIDPLGHQVGSMLEHCAERIRALPLSHADREAVLVLLSDIRQNMFVVDPRSMPACAELRAIRQYRPVALLVTQPPDWVTFEGAGRHVSLEGLLCDWAEQLPPGWIGVPTYHPGYRLTASMEGALARSQPDLRFLSGSLAQGLTEPLLTEADGMVTISSTSAVTALLLQKPVVVCGRSPFNGWCGRSLGGLADAPTLDSDEVASTLAFLTHRYAHLHQDLMAHPDRLSALMTATIESSDPTEWFLDSSGWTIDHARRLFDLPVAAPPSASVEATLA